MATRPHHRIAGLALLLCCLVTSVALGQNHSDRATPPPGMSVPLGEHVIFQPEPYELGPDSRPKDNVPTGTITRREWTNSEVFPSTVREYWVYVPAQYDPDGTKPAAVMVFQDGHNFVNRNNGYRATTVMDNLIAAGDMPITIGIFIEPGHRGDTIPEGNWGRRNNRSVEYDTPDDTYARFLIDEILPEVAKTYRLSDDPAMRGISGASSGGICAFSVCWHRPDTFRKCVSFIGSFTNIHGGHIYPALIRKTEPKPIRVFLQDGMNDLDNAHGNWWLGNQDMARALAFEDRYDYRFVAGEEGHNGKHGSAALPDALRWTWRGWDD